MDYRDTLNLPKTDFPMKADLPRKEPLILEKWQRQSLYASIQTKFQGRQKYILHDGPPYANGDIHIGHALNKTLKDIIVRYKTMRGLASYFVPGWDCHGLPVEHQLFKELGIAKHQINQLQFRKKAYDYAMRFVDMQKQSFKRLGISGDWDNPYLTLRPEYEAQIISAFGELVRRGYIYRGLKPVNWCMNCETALAEAEVEYREHASPSIYVKFKLVSRLAGQTDTYLLIWTTTPWTLVANVAVAVHPDFVYELIDTELGRIIVAKDLAESVIGQLGIKNCRRITCINGRALEAMAYEHPWLKRKGKIILADFVSLQEGTGLVHIAPGHGQEDYLAAMKYKLPTIMPVDAKGNFQSGIDEFAGMNVFEANKFIIGKLKALNLLLYVSQITHSYPHCWRCKSAVIFRATEQWFLNLDHLDLRQRLLRTIDGVKWIPPTGRERIYSMVASRPHWCLSRQRYWGVPIPAMVCRGCRKEFLFSEVIDRFAALVAQEGSDVWFKEETTLLPKDTRCPECGGIDFERSYNILDVWFDSGLSYRAVLKKRVQLQFPAQLYVEGSDQHRGWFQASLIPSVAVEAKAPFEAVLTHGFVVDAEGRKMSKSQGNVISPAQIINKYGADILRLWVASSDYNEDIRISEQILKRLADSYRKIRNTARFILSNLYDFNPDENRVEYRQLKSLDKWMLLRLQKTLRSASEAYDEFQFYKAYKAIYDFCNEELSMYYLDMVKGRLYTLPSDSRQRRSAQTVIYEALSVLVRLIAPILVFTSEEIWQYMPKPSQEEKVLSVHLLDWPEHNSLYAQDNLPAQESIETQLGPVLELIPLVSRALEEQRAQGLIGSSFDARIILLTKDSFWYKYLTNLEDDLVEIFKVSQIEIRIDESVSEVSVLVEKADGNKCLRCWNWSNSVGSDESHPSLCQRCLSSISKEAG
jgi:isoleucyl-tRNA synthetase